MKPKVTVIDYGLGNLFSIKRAFEHCDADVKITQSHDDIGKADRLVLPGVGAFSAGVIGLKELCLLEPIKEYALTGRPFLGICLGMQMMLKVSEEFGSHEGLGLIPGKVTVIPSKDVKGKKLKIPHIGWNSLYNSPNNESWENTILKGITPDTYMYFVHSYHAVPSDKNSCIAFTDYGGNSLSAVISMDYVYGCQFHPERSGKVGLRIIKNFLCI